LFDTHTTEERSLSQSAFLALAILDVKPRCLADLNGALLASGQLELSAMDAEDLLRRGVLANGSSCGVTAYYEHLMRDEQVALGEASVAITATPRTAEVHITRRCNLRCVYCAYDAGRDEGGLLPGSSWLAILGDLEEAHVQTAMFSGGEPLMHPDIEEILARVAEARFHAAILTNGTLLSARHARILSAPNIMTSVSLDASTSSPHDRLRGKGSFKAAITGLGHLAKSGAQFRTCCTLTTVNLDEIEDLVSLSASFGAREVEFGRVEPVGRAGFSEQLLLTREQVREANDRISRLAARYEGRMFVGFRSGTDSASAPPVRSADDGVYCTGGTSRVAIAPDGGVYPCVLAFGDDAFRAGGAAQEPLQAIWLHGQWEVARTAIPHESLVPCGTCPESEECIEKLCRIGAYYYSGDLRGQPPICPLLEASHSRQPRSCGRERDTCERR